MAGEALRAYLRELRTAQSINQKELAQAMGLAMRTLVEWEIGRTDDLKSTPMMRAVEHLNGSLDDIAALLLDENATAEVGRLLAQQRVGRHHTEAIHSSDGIALKLHDQLGVPLGTVIAQLPLQGLDVRPGDRIYTAIRYKIQGSSPIILVNSEPFTEVFRRDMGHAAAGDLEWGYGGRGPTLLAHGMIEYEFGQPRRTAREPLDDPVRERLKALLYQTVMSLPRGENGTIWSLHNEELRQLARVVQALVQ